MERDTGLPQVSSCSIEGKPFGSYCARHLNQLQLTADGNHQANQYIKNTDILNFSLYRGRGHFLLESEFQKYLENVSGTAAEVFSCHSFISWSSLSGRKRLVLI